MLTRFARPAAGYPEEAPILHPLIAADEDVVDS
jgi:hypothetical protein